MVAVATGGAHAATAALALAAMVAEIKYQMDGRVDWHCPIFNGEKKSAMTLASERTREDPNYHPCNCCRLLLEVHSISSHPTVYNIEKPKCIDFQT